MKMTWAVLAVMLTAFCAQASAPRRGIVVAPLERALERVSLGPAVGVNATMDRHGRPGALLTLGAQVGIYDRYGLTDEACEARRAEERRRLGGEKIKAWGDLLGSLQQQCRYVEQWWWPAYDAGVELGVALGPATGGQLRGWLSALSWRRFTLGVSSALLLGEDEAQSTALGLRLGPELAWHLRFDGRRSRPVLQAVLRPELSLLREGVFPHQAVLGLRFLHDL
jgi:hypothetical protein